MTKRTSVVKTKKLVKTNVETNKKYQHKDYYLTLAQNFHLPIEKLAMLVPAMKVSTVKRYQNYLTNYAKGNSSKTASMPTNLKKAFTTIKNEVKSSKASSKVVTKSVGRVRTSYKVFVNDDKAKLFKTRKSLISFLQSFKRVKDIELYISK